MPFSSHQSPRSGVNVVGLRPSLIAQHSLRSSSCALFTSARREGGFSVINDGRSPGKTPSLRGDSRGKNKIHSHEGAHKHTKRDLGWHPFLWVFVPFCGKSQLPVPRTVCNAFFPRISAKRSECCRPSAVADRSTFPPRLFLRSLLVSEAGRQFFSGAAREKRLPLAEIRG